MKNKKTKRNKKVLGTGEMHQSDIEKGGEWYQARLDLENVCKAAEIPCEVYPFDNYQGPYAKLKNGGKLWISDLDEYFYEGPKGNKTLKAEEMIEFLKTLSPLKLVHKSPEDKKPGVKWPRQKSTPEERKHLKLIRSIFAEILASYKPGDKVKLRDSSGIHSGKLGTIIDPKRISLDEKGVPKLPGHYKPIDWKKEYAIKLDDGEIITMFKNRVAKASTEKWTIRDWAGNYPFEQNKHQSAVKLGGGPVHTWDSFDDAEDFLTEQLGDSYDEEREHYEIEKL